MAGKFVGDVKVQWLSNSGPDRDMQLLTGFGYNDPAGRKWRVPKGAVVNGASIPRFFWTSFGPPFVGDYRRASVIHDHYCETKERSEEDTHRVFYDACRTGGIRTVTAKAMYSAVKTFGPHWKSMSAKGKSAAIKQVALTRIMSEDDFLAVQSWIEKKNPLLKQIDAKIEKMAPLVTVAPIEK